MKAFSHLLGVILLLCTLNFHAAAKRPNIVFCFADDWGRHASVFTEIDGPGTVNDVIATPNFDALAKEGVLFNNAFVSSPSCTPCRSALLSGQHFWRTGMGSILWGQWDESIPSYPLEMEKSGYHIGYSYKAWGPGTPISAPFGGTKNIYIKAGKSFNNFSQTATKLVRKGLSVDEAKETLYDEVRQNFKDFLLAREDGEPFCYWFGPTNVHRKWTKGSGKALWGMDPDQLKGKMPPFLPDVHEVREDLNDYLGEAQAFDRGIGVLFEVLKEIGEYENTIIAISGDHGAPGFPHGKSNLYDFGSQVPLLLVGPGIKGGRIVEDFVSLPDLAPTFMEAGGVAPLDVMTAKSLWKVLSSDQAGLVDPERTQVYIGRERHVPEAREGQITYPQRAIRTKDFLFIINFKPDRYPLGDHFRLNGGQEPSLEELTTNTRVTIADEDSGPTKAWIVSHRQSEGKTFFEHAYGKRPEEELYHIKNDPYQMNNLADSPEHQDTVTELRNKLMNELRSTSDPRLIDEGKFYEKTILGKNPVKNKESQNKP
ncbi:MAG: sulfatase [Verrucomicrobiota bacterium]